MPEDRSKIQFALIKLDSVGLLMNDTQADYEFCIPAKQKYLEKVLRIEPATNVMRNSKGRIGCTKEQWLCIVSTKGPDWNEKLIRIAHLSFVEKIIETYYE